MVAVKLIREERAAGAEALARFQREARAAARIKSEHIARVLDVDTSPEGEPYIVMELIDGTDLSDLVQRRGPLSPDDAVSYIMQACEGIAEAHALGMVHRDLKLKNLFLTKRRDGRALIKVIDFGVVKLTQFEEPHVGGDDTTVGADLRRFRDATLTAASMLVGSVHYMAPEQIRASNVVDARADIWSLGVCLYVMLTGDLPFQGENVASVCYAIQSHPAPDLRARAPHVPPELVSVVSRALEKNVRLRYASVAELAAALAPFSHEPTAAARIETILQSGTRSSPANAPPVAHGPPDALGPTLPIAEGGAKVRAESTIDQAAIGSLAPPPTSPGPLRRPARIVGGVLLAVSAAMATVVVWRGTRGMHGEESAVVASPSPVGTPPASSAIVPEPPTSSSVASTVPEPTSTSSAVPEPSASEARPHHTGTRTRPPKRPPPKSKSTSEAKPEPTSAYDQF